MNNKTNRRPKHYPHDPDLDVGKKRKRGSLPPYHQVILALLPIFAALFAGWAMFNLHLEVDWAVIVKAGLVGIVVGIVSYAINRFAVDWGTELAAGGYVIAGAFSLLSMMMVAACLWLFSFGGIVLPDVRNLRFEDHGIALSQNLQSRQEQASKALQIVPVIAATRDDLAYHSDCETRVGCISNRGGGAGTLSRVLDERARRAGAIAEQLDAGRQEYASIITRANKLLGEYQRVLNDNELSLKTRRQELIRLDGAFANAMSGLEQAVPVALIAAYAQELLDGAVIPDRANATRAVNALLRKHGQALQSVLGGIERETIGHTRFPGKAGLSDTLDYIGNFAPLAGVIWVAEGIFPLALWIYTLQFLVRQREQAERVRSGNGGPNHSAATASAHKRRRRQGNNPTGNASKHMNGNAASNAHQAIDHREGA